jgi:hypothetical protein
MPKVRLNDRLHALLFVSFSVTNEADVSRATGQIVFVSESDDKSPSDAPALPWVLLSWLRNQVDTPDLVL